MKNELTQIREAYTTFSEENLNEKDTYQSLYDNAKTIVYALEDGESGVGQPGVENVYKLATKLVDALDKAKAKIAKLEL